MAGLVGIAWLWLVGEAKTMSSMVQGLAQVGRAMPFDMSTPAFIGMWATMMVAMMVPSIVPLVLAYSKARPSLVATRARVLLLASYLLVWILTVVPALIAVSALNEIGRASSWLDRAGGAVLVLAGVYQFTRTKRVALGVYRQALGSPATPAAGDPVRAAQEGLHQGLCCGACCGVLMAVLLAVGVMNLAWMGTITVICFAEMNWRHGDAVRSSAGIGLLALGLAVVLHPQLLTTLAPNLA